MCTILAGKKGIAAAVAAAVMLCAVAVDHCSGALLAGDTTGLLHGSVYFDTFNKLGFTLFAADIEYCVYAPGKFTERPAFSGESVDPTHFVYAYQIAEVYDGFYGQDSGYINQFSVGLSDLNECAENASYVTATGTAPTSDGEIVTGSVKWVFQPGVFSSSSTSYPTAPSAVLYFTSPHEPEWDNATATGAGYDTQSMPSPAPEPATVAMLALGAAFVLRIRRRGS